MSERRGAALVTGCSSGIGRACALELKAAGFEVFASARRPERLADLAARGCQVLELDVTVEQQCLAAVEAAKSFDGAVSVLVNNAGYGLYGPVEQQPMEEMRRQFETNVFGAVRLAQLALPSMRAQRHGRIINVSSIAGRLTIAGGGFYHGSKHALESMSDALRVEVAPFGVRVVLVEPGPVKTPWGERAQQSLASAEPSEEEDDPYAGLKFALSRWLVSTSSPSAKSLVASSPAAVARVVRKSATASLPRSRYVVGPSTRALLVAHGLLPDRLWDAASSSVIHRGL